jgi:Kef-type K+ transport system membrane component KefB
LASDGGDDAARFPAPGRALNLIIPGVTGVDPVSKLGLAVALVLAVAMLGGDIAVRLRQPAVLGELLGGVLLGTVPLPLLEAIRTDSAVDMLARLGALVLLFEVGLACTVRDVARVGGAASAVAVLGTIGTLLAGWGAAALALPHASTLLQIFLAAALTATSIGITARVLRDAGAGRGREAYTILGASVLDDVLGLVVLGIVSAAAAHGTAEGALGLASIVWLVAKTVLFLAVAIALGMKLSPMLFRVTSRLRSEGALVATGLSLCFLLAYASNVIGLAPIVGAFTAGLVLEDSHSAHFVARGERSLADRLEPIASWLVPIFFVLMGVRADLRALADAHTLLLAGALAAAAVVGKMLCAAGAPRGSDRLAIAFGMLPRGEVSLVFANLGLSTGLLDRGQYAALVAVVVLTTLLAPALLRGRLDRQRGFASAGHASG